MGLAAEGLALDLSRACYLEATWRRADCTAIAYVVQRRAARVGRPWAAVLRAYSAIDARNARARAVRTFPWGDVDGMSPAFNAKWAGLRQHAQEIVDGQHANPCKGAEHWGGKMDAPRGRMVPARCSTATANTFYAVRSK